MYVNQHIGVYFNEQITPVSVDMAIANNTKLACKYETIKHT